ncbi:MAG: type II secretion system protein [Candidatus Paceibacterota bacterium]|jgi:type II secretion system protein G
MAHPYPSMRGFTLIELLVVIAIIGILSSVVLASLNTARNKANDARRASDMHSIQMALEMYRTSNTGYPVTTGWSSRCAAWPDKGAGNVIPGLVPGYLPKMPDDPQMDSSGNLCCYLYYSDGIDYKLLDYNCPTLNYNSVRSLIDPTRDSGTDACIVDGDSIWSWAIYTDNACSW